MTNLDGLGKRVQNARQKRGWDVPTCARKVGCTTEQIECIEDSKLNHPLAILAILDRMATTFGMSVEDLLFGHSTGGTARVNEMKVHAFRIILDNSLTDSARIVDEVFGQIEHEHDQALAGVGDAIAYRNRSTAFEIDEDRVRDLVEQAKRSSEGPTLGFAK